MAIVWYLSANRPEDDSSTSGGAVDTNMRLMLRSDGDSLNGGSGDQVDLVSDSASDTQSVDLAGYDTSDTWQTESVTLTGTTNVQSTNTYKHLRKVEAASDAVGTITIAEYNSGSPTELFTITAGERGRAALFLKAEANAGGGATKYLYEKVFVYSSGSTYSGGDFYNSEDEDSELAFDLEMSSDSTTTGGSESVANRATEPSTGGTYSWADHASGDKHTVGDAEDGALTDTEAQGVWVRLTLAAGRSAELQVQYTLNFVASSVS